MKRTQHTLLALALLTLPTTASAQLVVVGNGGAAECYQYALSGNMGTRSALSACDGAFTDMLSKTDRAATHVNRGILLMRGGKLERAEADYDRALAIRPDLTEAYVNRGAAQIRQGNYTDAVESLTRSLEDLDSPTRASALYNRAIAHDNLENDRAAYTDLKAAQAIRPEWELVSNMLRRYTVTRKSDRAQSGS